jgi:hypothetical protein
MGFSWAVTEECAWVQHRRGAKDAEGERHFGGHRSRDGLANQLGDAPALGNATAGKAVAVCISGALRPAPRPRVDNLNARQW